MSTSVTEPSADRGVTPRRARFPFWAQVLLGLVAGIALGFLARTYSLDWLSTTLSTVGSTFVSLLRVIVVPLVLTAIIVSIANLRQVTNAARLAVQTLVWFAITSLISVVIGITIGLLTNPGARATIDTAGAEAPSTQGTWLDFLSSIVPANILGLQASSSDDGVSLSFNVLQLVVLGIALGAAALAVGEKAEPFLAFNRSVLEIVQKLVWWVIRLAPIGTAGLIGRAVANYGWDLIGPLAVFTADVYIGCAIVLFVLYPVLVKAHGLSARRYFAGAWPAIQFAFVSRSSVGTLPLTQRVVTRNLGVSPDYASFAVPFGATTKMDGCAAIYPALAAITVAQLFGIELGLPQYLLIAFVSVVGSAATAGLTGAVVMLTLTLSTLGLPLEGVGLLLAIDPILDMMRTATNVAGQALVPLIVAKRNGLLDEQVYNSANVSSIEVDRDPSDSASQEKIAVPA
ncbi:cation:dicarboxylase symporter family transporter [Auraticoccus sp. F435]|uniref:Cation:dicarboxylase symporter family transporter n=1 Tax=Auraticoccus cholistanensis TaxID=2656650 RepID=A0A6A9UYG6_9ACTN|nr:dicarboxylate/amino acid:cation symporter [Auraticoccus cholistanensis]MVA76945.1 cation:dicarboxylase symporter family transporter [Auraticoccus cholistanensis]